MGVQRASAGVSSSPAPSPSPVPAGSSPESFASDVAVALLVGLADIPCGPERAKACASRRLELRSLLRQVQLVLDETERARGTDCEGRDLGAGRLAWALETTVGLQHAACALGLLEQAALGGLPGYVSGCGVAQQADAACDSVVVPSAPLWMAYGPRMGPLRCSTPAAMCRDQSAALAQEYGGVLTKLEECKQRIADLSPALGCSDMLPSRWPAPRLAPPQDGPGPEFWEGLRDLISINTADVGRAFNPAAKVASLLRPLLALLLESNGPLELMMARSLPRGVPKPRSPFP